MKRDWWISPQGMIWFHAPWLGVRLESRCPALPGIGSGMQYTARDPGASLQFERGWSAQGVSFPAPLTPPQLGSPYTSPERSFTGHLWCVLTRTVKNTRKHRDGSACGQQRHWKQEHCLQPHCPHCPGTLHKSFGH